jgi:hypothetical protein
MILPTNLYENAVAIATAPEIPRVLRNAPRLVRNRIVHLTFLVCFYPREEKAKLKSHTYVYTYTYIYV